MGDELKRIQKKSSNKDLALLAQEVGFLVERFTEFKVQTEADFKEVKDNTSGSYTTKATGDDHERRLVRLEKAALWVLGTTFTVVFLAVLGLVVIRKGSI